MGRYFGTDGVRGEANTELTLDMAVSIGQYLGWIYASKKEDGKPRILIGKDTRQSGSLFEMGLAAGAISAGADVYLLGVCPTPAVSHLVIADQFDCGIMVSASHNPYWDNGIKVFNHEGRKMDEEILCAMEDYMDGLTSIELASRAQIGTCIFFEEGMEEYKKWLKETVPANLEGLRLCLDLANGSATSCAAETLRDLGAEVYCISDHPNGFNINKECGSTHPEKLQEFVLEKQADAGLAFDGDADRLIAVNAKGELVNGDYLLYILGRNLKEKGMLPDDMVVTTVMANIGLYQALENNGINSLQTPVGDKYVFEQMEKNGYALGGEQSGHIIFYPDEATGDGLMTALHLLQVMAQTGQSIEELSQGLFIYPQLLENVKVTDKEVVLNDPKIAACIDEINEGLHGRGRLLVRPSGTEPLIRVMAEAKSDEECARCVHAVTDLITELGYAA